MRSAATCTISRASGTPGPRPRTSHHFDPIWYLRHYPAVAEAIAAGKWLCALHHYLANDTPTAFDPLPEFSEAYYLDRYKDVAAAVEANDRRNGYDHFLTNGVSELRSPSATIDLQYYFASHPSVRSDLDAGRARDAFAHYLTIGREQGLAARPSGEQIIERQAAALNRRRADNLLPGSARAVLDFSCAGTPAVSVIMLLRDGFPLTLMTLGSLRASLAGDIELILIDAGSTDDTRRIGRFVHGARGAALRRSISISSAAANAALNCVGADAVLFLDSAVELAPGALAAALQRLHSDPRIGAVGGKLLRAHGRLEGGRRHRLARRHHARLSA